MLLHSNYEDVSHFTYVCLFVYFLIYVYQIRNHGVYSICGLEIRVQERVYLCSQTFYDIHPRSW